MSELATTAKKSIKYPVLCLISLFMMFVFGKVVPTWSTVTPVGVSMLGVFLGALLMTMSTNQTFWPPVIGIFAMVMCGYVTANGALSTWFGNTTIQQIIWVSALAGALSDSGAINVLAQKMMRIKALKGRPLLFLFALFGMVLICSALAGSPTAMLLLWYPILDGICDSCGIRKDSDLKRALLLGVYISCMGAYIFPFKGVQMSSIAITSAVLENYGLTFNQGAYFITATLAVIAFVALYTLFIKFVWRIDLTPLASFDASTLDFKAENSKMNKRQKILMGAMLLGIFWLFIGPFLQGGLKEIYNTIGNTWVWIAIVGILTMVHMDGKPLIDGALMLKNKTMWGIVAMAGCFVMCGSAISSDDLGIKTWISQVLGPLVSGASWPVLIILCVVIATVFTNITNGMPVSFTLNAIAVPFAAEMVLAGQIADATPLGTAIIMSGMCAFLTYGAIAYAPLLLGREEMTHKFLWTKGVVTNLIYIVVACVICIIGGYVL